MKEYIKALIPHTDLFFILHILNPPYTYRERALYMSLQY